MTVSLPAELEQFVQQQLASEKYQSREQLLAEAVRMLRDRNVPRSVQADWFGQALEQFRAIAALQTGWDSHRAAAPDTKLVHAAEKLLYRLSNYGEVLKPHINPTRRGGVQFEWEAGPRSLEVEIVGEDLLTYFYQDEPAGVEEQGQLSPQNAVEVLLKYLRCVATERPS